MVTVRVNDVRRLGAWPFYTLLAAIFFFRIDKFLALNAFHFRKLI